jgi:CopG family transcriptional regulator/antitoxin EndoAI
MRTTKTISVTLPPEMLTRAAQLAKKENRTMSELVREALRCYERKTWWDEMDAYGRKTAKAAGIKSEQDVIDAIHSMRKEGRAHKRSAR